MYRLYCFIVLFFVVCMLSCQALATVIYDNGKTRSLKPYYEHSKIKAPNFAMEVPKSLLIKPEALIGDLVNDVFPVSNSNLTLGEVVSRSVDLPYYERPACLVGVDKISYGWLQHHYRILSREKAVCFVVNVKTLALFNQLKKSFPKLVFLADDGDMFVKSLAIRHYPVVITREFIEQ